MFYCNFYNQLRVKLFSKTRAIQNNFIHVPVDETFTILMREQVIKDTAEFLDSSYTKRRKTIYN